MSRFFWNIFCFILWASQLIRLFRHSKRGKGIILCYGAITDRRIKKQPWNADGRYVDKRRFNRQIRHLLKHYVVVPPSRIAEDIEKGKTLPEKSAVLTFDYGYMSSYENALKHLNKHSIPFGFSLVTGFIQNRELLWHDRLELAVSRSRSRTIKVKVGGSLIDEKTATPRQKARTYLLLKSIGSELDVRKRDMFLEEIENQTIHGAKESNEIPDDCYGMTTHQVAEIARGADTGSQTANLVDLTHIPRRNLLDEVYESRQKISKIAETECNYFVYPMMTEGKPDEMLSELVQKSGYSFALTNIPDYVEPKSNPYFLPRITITGNENFFTFAVKLAGIGIKRNMV